MESKVSILIQCPVFRGLTEDELLDLLKDSAARLRNLEKGQLLAQAGDEVHFLHIVASGSVRGEMVDFSGKVIKIEDIHPPRPLAAAFLFGEQNRYPVNITANENTSLLSIPVADLLRMMQRHQLVLRNFLHSISSRGQFLSSKIRFLSFTTIKGKLAQYLLDLAEKEGSDTFRMPHSQSQLSELFGVTRPSIGRAVSEMNREGIIRADGKQVSLMDRAGLSALLK